MALVSIGSYEVRLNVSSPSQPRGTIRLVSGVKTICRLYFYPDDVDLPPAAIVTPGVSSFFLPFSAWGAYIDILRHESPHWVDITPAAASLVTGEEPPGEDED